MGVTYHIQLHNSARWLSYWTFVQYTSHHAAYYRVRTRNDAVLADSSEVVSICSSMFARPRVTVGLLQRFSGIGEMVTCVSTATIAPNRVSHCLMHRFLGACSTATWHYQYATRVCQDLWHTVWRGSTCSGPHRTSGSSGIVDAKGATPCPANTQMTSHNCKRGSCSMELHKVPRESSLACTAESLQSSCRPAHLPAPFLKVGLLNKRGQIDAQFLSRSQCHLYSRNACRLAGPHVQHKAADDDAKADVRISVIKVGCCSSPVTCSTRTDIVFRRRGVSVMAACTFMRRCPASWVMSTTTEQAGRKT